MSKHLRYLSPHEESAVSEYISRLQRALGQKLIGLWLFGSKARGKPSSDSDIDLLIILTTAQSETRWLIWGLGSDVSLEYDVLLNAHIIDATYWDDERRYRGTLWHEIERDGVPLHTQVSSASATLT